MGSVFRKYLVSGDLFPLGSVSPFGKGNLLKINHRVFPMHDVLSDLTFLVFASSRASFSQFSLGWTCCCCSPLYAHVAADESTKHFDAFGENEVVLPYGARCQGCCSCGAAWARGSSCCCPQLCAQILPGACCLPAAALLCSYRAWEHISHSGAV